MPQDGRLFRQFAADPRAITYSVGWRWNDEALVKNVVPVSYGNNFPIYRWFSVWPCGGALQLNLEGALWGVFDVLGESAPLMNADYYVGIPLEYCCGRWSFRLRLFHISSHLGDEFLLQNPEVERLNPSAEYLDLFGSYYLGECLRLYAGAGWVVHDDESFNSGNVYAAGGAEVRLYKLGFYNYCQNLYGTPLFAMHIEFNDRCKRKLGQTYILGYEVGKTCGTRQVMRVFLEYHDGYNPDGQFCDTEASYVSIRFSYGY